MIHNKIFALIYRATCLVVILLGLLEHLGVRDGTFHAAGFMYYTIQSNILAWVLFFLLTVRTLLDLFRNGISGKTGFFARFEFVCVIDLLLTLIVYWALLAPGSFSMDGNHSLWTFKNLSVHLFSPLMCLLDYILFTNSHHLKYRDVYAVVIYPLCYVLFTSVAGFSGYTFYINTTDGNPVRFPYFFLDFDRLGAFVFVYIGALVVFFLILSHLLYLLDRKVTKPVILH